MSLSTAKCSIFSALAFTGSSFIVLFWLSNVNKAKIEDDHRNSAQIEERDEDSNIIKSSASCKAPLSPPTYHGSVDAMLCLSLSFNESYQSEAAAMTLFINAQTITHVMKDLIATRLLRPFFRALNHRPGEVLILKKVDRIYKALIQVFLNLKEVEMEYNFNKNLPNFSAPSKPTIIEPNEASALAIVNSIGSHSSSISVSSTNTVTSKKKSSKGRVPVSSSQLKKRILELSGDIDFLFSVLDGEDLLSGGNKIPSLKQVRKELVGWCWTYASRVDALLNELEEVENAVLISNSNGSSAASTPNRLRSVKDRLNNYSGKKPGKLVFDASSLVAELEGAAEDANVRL